jgi:hypothetical protein
MKKQMIMIAVIIGLLGGAGIFYFLRADVSDDLQRLKESRDCLEVPGGVYSPAGSAATSTEDIIDRP